MSEIFVPETTRAANVLAVGSFRHQRELAIIDQKAMTRLNRLQNFRMGQEYAGIVARRVIVVEREGLPCNEVGLAILEFANAQLRSLQVGENADRPPQFLFDIAQAARRVSRIRS